MVDTKQDDIAQASDAVRRGSFTQAALGLLNRIIDRNAGSQLISAVIHAERTEHETDEEAIAHVMSILELLAEHSMLIACTLMLYLYQFSDNHYLHDVCDAIDIWISKCDSVELARRLKLVALDEQNPKLRRHYESLIQSREKK